jgi:hypothetical protein
VVAERSRSTKRRPAESDTPQLPPELKIGGAKGGTKQAMCCLWLRRFSIQADETYLFFCHILSGLRQNSGTPFRDAMEIILEQQKEIKELSTYYQKIFTRNFDFFIELNAKVRDANS